MKTTLAYSIGGSIVLLFWVAIDHIAGNNTIIIPLLLLPVFAVFFALSKAQKTTDQKIIKKLKKEIEERPCKSCDWADDLIKKVKK